MFVVTAPNSAIDKAQYAQSMLFLFMLIEQLHEVLSKQIFLETTMNSVERFQNLADLPAE